MLKKQLLSTIMPNNNQVIAAIQCIQTPFYYDMIRITDLFPDELTKEGKLILAGVDFYRLGSTIDHLDFSNCILRDCRFDHTLLSQCIFDSDVTENNSFDDCFIEDTNQGLTPSIPEATPAPITPSTVLASSDEDDEDMFPSEPIYDRNYDEYAIERRQRCWKERCIHYPEDFLNFDKIASQLLTRNFPMKACGDGFYRFELADVDYDKPSTGWKLHVSVYRFDDNMKNAFNLLAPYLAKQVGLFYFKFTIPDFSQSGRLFSNAQFTIYLHDFDENDLPFETVKKMIDDVTDLFQKNHIKPAITIPASDSPTVSPYFSLRNDRVKLPSSFDFSLMPDEYLPAEISGFNFNASQETNPYQALIKNTKPFNMLNHFKAFNITAGENKLHEASSLLAVTLFAYLNEYSHFSTLDEKEMTALDKQAFSGNAIIDASFIKEGYKENEEIRKGIAMAFMILSYLKNYGNHLTRLPDFSKCFPKGSQFVADCAAIHTIISSLPQSAPFSPRSDLFFTPPSFNEYLKTRQEEIVRMKKSSALVGHNIPITLPA